ncbi:hypothetical protein M422DRAFT_262696 [Sphaerobolus stellatus SS14]|uniref:Uncharacterized protein n=1 Tax=Sphaerobolus stellatus (strain SS14) TaxID=990650 RepID=A0A0C9V0H7_SPHS4|nr:hypothetical protein M422DRAFT_262696 [Sphaerobolus stellatus SS14]
MPGDPEIQSPDPYPSSLMEGFMRRHPLETISMPDATADFPNKISLWGLLPSLKTFNVSPVYLERAVDILGRGAVCRLTALNALSTSLSEPFPFHLRRLKYFSTSSYIFEPGLVNLVHNTPNLRGLKSCVPRILVELAKLQFLKYFCLDNCNIFPDEENVFVRTMRMVEEQTTIEYLRTSEMFLGDLPIDPNSWYRLIRDGKENYKGFYRMKRHREAGIEGGIEEREFSALDKEYVSEWDFN